MSKGENKVSDLAPGQEVVLKTGEGQTVVVQEPAKEPAPTIENVMEELKKERSSKERLLNESKEWKAKAQSLKEDQEKKEKEILTQKENWKELLEKERQERAADKEAAMTFKRHALSNALDAEIMKIAPDALNINLIKTSLPPEMVSAFEENNEIKFTGIKESVEVIKKNMPYLFKSSSIPHMVNGKPTVNAKSPSPANQLSQMKTTDEIIAFWKANPQIK